MRDRDARQPADASFFRTTHHVVGSAGEADYLEPVQASAPLTDGGYAEIVDSKKNTVYDTLAAASETEAVMLDANNYVEVDSRRRPSNTSTTAGAAGCDVDSSYLQFTGLDDGYAKYFRSPQPSNDGYAKFQSQQTRAVYDAPAYHANLGAPVTLDANNYIERSASTTAEKSGEGYVDLDTYSGFDQDA